MDAIVQRMTANLVHMRHRLLIIMMIAIAPLTTPLVSAQDGATRHGVIEVGSSGVKVQAYELTREDAIEALTAPEAGAGLRYQMFADRSLTDHNELDVNPYRAENVERTADAVKYFVDYLYSEHGIRRENAYVVGSSGVGRLPHATQVASAVAARTGQQMEFIPPTREGELNFNWITPLYRRGQALVIDVGSNNVSASYTRTSGPRLHEGFELAELGTKSLLDTIVADNGGAPPADLDGQLTRFQAETLVPQIYRASVNHPGAANRQRVYLLGGIIWALSAHERPNQVGEEWVRIHPGDIAAFHARVVAGDAFKPSPEAMDLIEDSARRDEAISELARVSDVFTEDQLLAGAVMLQALNQALELDEREGVFFSRVGRDGWRSQYLLEKIAGPDAASSN